MFVVANLVDLLLNPYIWSSIMDIVQKNTQHGIKIDDFKTLIYFLLLNAFLSIIFWSLHGPARVMEMANAFRVRKNYKEYLLSGVFSMPLAWHTDHHSGDTIDKIEKGTGALFHFSEDSFEIVYAIVQLFGSLAMLIYLYPKSLPLIVFIFGISVVITISFDKVLITQYRDISKTENEISASIFDSISNITTIIILRVERLVFKSIVHKIDSPFDLFNRSNKLNEFKWFLTSMCCRFMVVSVLALYFYEHIGSSSGMSVGKVYLLFDYLNKVKDIFFRFAGMYSNVVKQSARVSNSEILAKDFVENSLSNHVLPENWNKIDIRNLSFSYDKEGQMDLDNISIELFKGQKVAFVGQTGSGKTTMLHIIRGLYNPNNLKLYVDDKLVEEGFSGIERAISLVPQDPEIFSSTIIQNIALGAEYSDRDIKVFTDLSCFSDVVLELPKGMESSINEKGVNLSGGQRQRLALSRGLLASLDKDIILLDEPTSSLDPKTEFQVYKNIMDHFRDKLIISTIHKFNLLGLFDQIFVFEAGKVVGYGNFDYLLSNCNQFKEMYQKFKESS